MSDTPKRSRTSAATRTRQVRKWRRWAVELRTKAGWTVIEMPAGQLIHDAVMEAAAARGTGRDASDREGLAWRTQAIFERKIREHGCAVAEPPVDREESK